MITAYIILGAFIGAVIATITISLIIASKISDPKHEQEEQF